MGCESLATDLLADIKSPGLDGISSICPIRAHGFHEKRDQQDFFLSPHIATLRLLSLSE